MKNLLPFFLLFSFQIIFSQQKFQIIYLNDDYETPIMADQKGKPIKKLDSAVYGLNYQPETYAWFSVFSLKDKNGWTAIDINENRLFEVLNTETGTPSPDHLIENKIRIVGKEGKIGFANEKGVIVIPPKFEQVSSFHKGKAIIGHNCKKIPWDNSEDLQDHSHYSTKCEKHGFINTKGKVIKYGQFSFEEIANEIGWKNDWE